MISLVERDENYERYLKSNSLKWANDYSNGHYSVPRFNGVVVPKGTIQKLVGSEPKEDEVIEIEFSTLREIEKITKFHERYGANVNSLAKSIAGEFNPVYPMTLDERFPKGFRVS